MDNTLDKIRVCTKAYADSFAALKDRVAHINKEIEQVKNRHIRGIKTAVIEATKCKNELSELIEANKELFIKPKTHTWHGVRVGITKSKGKLKISNEKKAIERLKDLVDDPDLYIKTESRLIKSQLEQLDALTQKKIGARIEGSGDSVMIKNTDSEIEKFVDALLKNQKDKSL